MDQSGLAKQKEAKGEGGLCVKATETGDIEEKGGRGAKKEDLREIED